MKLAEVIRPGHWASAPRDPPRVISASYEASGGPAVPLMRIHILFGLTRRSHIPFGLVRFALGSSVLAEGELRLRHHSQMALIL